MSSARCPAREALHRGEVRSARLLRCSDFLLLRLHGHPEWIESLTLMVARRRDNISSLRVFAATYRQPRQKPINRQSLPGVDRFWCSGPASALVDESRLVSALCVTSIVRTMGTGKPEKRASGARNGPGNLFGSRPGPLL
jgi:hypothetical protein